MNRPGEWFRQRKLRRTDKRFEKVTQQTRQLLLREAWLNRRQAEIQERLGNETAAQGLRDAATRKDALADKMTLYRDLISIQDDELDILREIEG